MTRYYLNVPFREKDEAKALGARFDWDAKQWYIDDESRLSLFTRWLPPDLLPQVSQHTSPDDFSLSVADTASSALSQEAPAGITLSQLLSGVAAAIRQACGEGVWTIVEIVEARARGHVYLEVSERAEDGRPIAKARAIIWESVAEKILPAFEKATGVTIGPGIKLLVLAKPSFHVQYGFSLHIEAIDAQFTLGYLEARRREIRARLQREGVFENNRLLPPPWDFNSVLVVAPHGGAGLGDFQQEAARLEHYGVCAFTYVYSRFQGEGAAREIVAAIHNALAAHHEAGPPDVVVIIRGGGATGDLAWLDDYDLARAICDLTVPVFTGIGHQRDSTIPDEVAHTAFDTPSKVIAGIEHRIRQRTDEAIGFIQALFTQVDRLLVHNQKAIDLLSGQVRENAVNQLTLARQTSQQAYNTVGRLSMRQVFDARIQAGRQFAQNRELARQQLHKATELLPRLLFDIQNHSQARLVKTRHRVGLNAQFVLGQVRSNVQQSANGLQNSRQRLFEAVYSNIRHAQRDTQSLVREIVGQGPEKTLNKGFAIIRDADGKPQTNRGQAVKQDQLIIEFKDGQLAAQPLGTKP